MLNKFIRGIISKVHSVLGDEADNYKYYDDGINQNFQTPCFYPHSLSPRLTKRAGGGYEYTLPFVVHYFPEDPKDNRDKNEIGDLLLRSLDTISIEVGKLGMYGEYVGEQLVRGTDIYFTVEDDRVLCRVTYHLLTQIKPNSVDEMDTISVAENVN